MSDFVVQEVKRLLTSDSDADMLRGAAMFRQHNLAIAPAFSFKDGAYPVWRPFLKADSICGVCHSRIAGNAQPALWGGKTFHFSCWHIDCWKGLYDVNTKDRADYEAWVATQPPGEMLRWHRIERGQ